MSRETKRDVVQGLCGLLVAAIGLLSSSGRTLAAQGSAASIVGVLTDESGAVLPGVTVTATSPALQVEQVTSVSDERGEYRLSPLPIGTYEVVYELAGFQTVRRGNVRLTVGFVAKLDESLKIGTFAETVSVSGASPVVDVTSTATSTQLTRETLELIPTTRNSINSLMAQAPGVRGVIDVGGSNFSAIPTFHAYGQDGEQWTTLEGVSTQTPNGGGSGNYWDYATFEETRVQTVGKAVDVPVRGVSIEGIVKSGGNDFHGNGFYSRTPSDWQSTNIDSALAAQGITSGNKQTKQQDGSGELGGRIIQSKLWFYGSVRGREDVAEIPGVLKPDGSPALFSQSQKYGTIKIPWQVSSGNRFVGFYQRNVKIQDGSLVNLFTPWESRDGQYNLTATGKMGWQGVRENLTASLQFGRWYYNSEHNQNAADGRVSTTDLVTLMNTGTGVPSSTQNHNYGRRRHTAGTMGWYKSTGSLGNHEIKTGFDYQAVMTNSGLGLGTSGDYQLIFQSGVPFELTTYNTPTRTAENSGQEFDIYGADNWIVANRLTISLGARYSRDANAVPAQCRPAGPWAVAACVDQIALKTWTSVAPRLSAAYDLAGNGKMVIKGGWGRFDHTRSFSEVVNVNPFSNIATTYRWHDNDLDKLYDPGEVNLDTNGADFVSQTGAIRAVPNPNQPQPKQDEYFLSFERELISNFAFRATGIYAKSFNIQRAVGLQRPYSVYNIPITRPDPGPDGRVGSADDPGTFITYYDYPAAYRGSAFGFTTFDSPAQADQTFKSIELAATKRLSSGWQFMASYSATKKHVPVPENSSFDPNTEINSSDNTWEWLARVSGAYLFPHGVIASANMENRSGTRQARQVLFSGGTQIPTIVLNVEPIGSLQLPAIRSLDLRAEKAFSLPKGQKVTARLNVYNALNANAITAWTVRSGASYLKPTAILPPRIFELAVSYTF